MTRIGKQHFIEERHAVILQLVNERGRVTARELGRIGRLRRTHGGTTAAEMRRFLADKKNIAVITPSIDVASWLHMATSISVYLLNGFLNRDSLSTIGVPSEESILHMNAAKAFCGAAGRNCRCARSTCNPGHRYIAAYAPQP